MFSTPFAHTAGRTNMSVLVSRSNGAWWAPHVNVDEGPAAYSALIVLNTTHYGLAYERPVGITFVALPIPEPQYKGENSEV